MPDLMPERMQDFLHSWKPAVRKTGACTVTPKVTAKSNNNCCFKRGGLRNQTTSLPNREINFYEAQCAPATKSIIPKLHYFIQKAFTSI